MLAQSPSRVNAIWRRLRQMMNRSDWVVRLLGLPRSPGTDTHPGLVILQVDGLSRRQLEIALARRRLPFVDRLLAEAGYRLHTLYSGLPSTTAAFQAELLYGVPCAVPAYSYFHRKLGARVHMMDAPAAACVQEELSGQTQGLLEGGVSYGSFFDGGAAEQHFCPHSLGLWSMVRAMPLAVVGLLFIHGFALVRVATLLVVELFLALFDAARGMLGGHGIASELAIVVHRVMLCVMMRELCVMRVKADTERGVPIVFVNFIGYDEQAHVRGPDSRFAHWTLKGIDDAIKRIWHAARRSPARDYDLWILSDHGQERARPYREHTGKWIEEALGWIVAELGETVRARDRHRGDRKRRAEWMGAGRLVRWLTSRPDELPVGENATWTVVANGPVGHCYAPGKLPHEGIAAVARSLVERAQVPAALVADGPQGAFAFTRRGRFHLPEQAAELSDDAAMTPHLAADLVRLVHQVNAGEVVILGHVKGEPTLSFAMEHGAHGGIGPEEIRAFAVLPPNAPVGLESGVMRACDLHRGALRFMGRLTGTEVREPSGARGGRFFA